MKKVLFITQYIPYAANSGITVKILNLLKCMAAVCDVECVFLCEDQHEAERALQKCDINIKNHIIFLKIPTKTASRYLTHLYQILFVRKGIRKELSKIIQTCQPDLFWVEFGYICHLIPFLRQFGKSIYYGSHNSQFQLEFSIWKNIPGALQKVARLPMLFCHWIHEQIFFPMADKILCISEMDLQYYKKKIPEKKLRLLPYFFDDSHLVEETRTIGKKPFVVIIGSLQSYQNYDAVLYALKDIWPEVQKMAKDLSLYIVGKLPKPGSTEEAQIQKMMATHENVYFAGDVPSVVSYVKSALVNIVPIRIGSGVRTKIIESSACKTPVVSTSIGAEGLPFQNGISIFLEDEIAPFANRIMGLVADLRKRDEMAESAHQIYKSTLSLDAGILTMKEIFDGEHVS